MASRNTSKNRKRTKNKRSSAPSKSPATAGPQAPQEQAPDPPVEETSAGSRPTPGYIPEAVSQRMIRRVALFCGIPSFLGMSSFVANYFLITGDVVDLPPYFTLIETLTCFGLGFVGISYGVLSASWEPHPGSALGWSEFRTNLGTLTQQWREYGAQKRNASPADRDTTETDD